MKRHNVRWAWLDKVEPSAITEHHVLLVYGLNNKPCPVGKCRQNCKGNPLCLNALGEAKWLEEPEVDGEAGKELETSEDADAETLKSAKERKDDVVGLVNYGNTCYLNSFLQLYYRMTDLRQAVYDTREISLGDEEESSQGGRSVIRELKLIFAQLQIGVHSPVEPAGLVNALGLQLQEPQDAPEFHSLFMTFLERHMGSPSASAVRSLLEGSFMFTNHCLACGYTSSQQTTFLELTLELSDLSHLAQSIAQSLATEALTGDNQYSCPLCEAKRDGERRVRLTRLPPLLCFQLLRFTYDRKRGCKRKNKARIQIPAQLDMARFMGREEEAVGRWRYVLKGILIHLGPQPFSGHYVAVVHDYQHGWIVCNDEQTTRLKALNLARLETDAMRNRPGTASPGRAPAGDTLAGERVHESRNAYMLLYEAQAQFEERAESNYTVAVPSDLREWIEAENVSVRAGWHAAARTRWEARERNLARDQRMRALVRELYSPRSVGASSRASSVSSGNSAPRRRSARHHAENGDGEAKAEELPADAVKDDSPSPPVDTEEFVPADWLSRCLRLSPLPAKRPPDDSLCAAGFEWSERLLCPHGRLRPDTAPERVKLVPSRLVDALLGPLAGASRRMPRSRALCLTCVRLQCVLHRFTARAADLARLLDAWKKGARTDEAPALWVGRASLNRWRAMAKKALHEAHAVEEGAEESGESGGEAMAFNADLLCRHGNLTLDESKRRLLPASLWRAIVGLFPPGYARPAEMDQAARACPLCTDERTRQQIGVARQREQLAALLNARKGRAGIAPRRLVPPLPHALLPNDFLARWRRYLRQPSPELQPQAIDTGECLCPHGLLARPVSELVLAPKAPLTPVSQEEWAVLASFYPLNGPALRVAWRGEEEGWRSEPDLCGTCFADLASQREQYRDATIHIRKIEPPAPGAQLLGVPDEEEVEEEPPAKAARMSAGAEPSASGSRRSVRQRRLASDRAVRVNSDWTLRQLKVELMNMFAAAPFDQHLMLSDGTDLSLGECTLQTLGIRPGDLLLLWTEEATLNCFTDCSNDDAGKAAAEETGFRGTKLMAS